MSGLSDYGKAPSQGECDAYIKKEDREKEAGSQEKAGSEKRNRSQESCSEKEGRVG